MVDDERDVVLTLVALLRDEGYEVKGACSAAEALVALAELDPLLIAISGRYTKGSDRILGKISGFNHQLAKPFDPKALIALLKHAKVGHAQGAAFALKRRAVSPAPRFRLRLSETSGCDRPRSGCNARAQ